MIVPLVAKFAVADFATATLPDALTLESTVPRFTVAVRRDAAALDEPGGEVVDRVEGEEHDRGGHEEPLRRRRSLCVAGAVLSAAVRPRRRRPAHACAAT